MEESLEYNVRAAAVSAGYWFVTTVLHCVVRWSKGVIAALESLEEERESAVLMKFAWTFYAILDIIST